MLTSMNVAKQTLARRNVLITKDPRCRFHIIHSVTNDVVWNGAIVSNVIQKIYISESTK